MAESLFCVVEINGFGEFGAWQVISGFIAAIMASSKGRSSLLWFLVGFFTPCCIGPILVALLPDLTATTAAPPADPTQSIPVPATQPTAVAAPQPPSSADLVPRWFYEEAGEPAGPVSAQSLRALLQSGSIDRATLVWREGMPDWAPYEQSDADGPAN